MYYVYVYTCIHVFGYKHVCVYIYIYIYMAQAGQDCEADAPQRRRPALPQRQIYQPRVWDFRGSSWGLPDRVLGKSVWRSALSDARLGDSSVVDSRSARWPQNPPTLGWHYLSNATCLMPPRSVYALFIVSRITIVCYLIRRFWRNQC